MSHIFSTLLLLFIVFAVNTVDADELPEIRIIASVEEMITLYEESGYWGELEPDSILEVPPILAVVTVKEWRNEAASMTVQDKKELFYRSLLPLVLYSNTAIEQERDRLLSIESSDYRQRGVSDTDAPWLLDLGSRYGVIKVDGDSAPTLPEPAQLKEFLEELLLRVDTIPASLALGQGAYESGYGTSRFALEGNSYFGQWVYGGKGMKPKEKRASKGNYGVAAYEWPLDSVRSYMLNLNSHRAYAGLREKRASLRREDQAVTGEALALTLTSYSERGMAYVESLIGMMRYNELDAADDARLGQEPLILVVNAGDAEDAASLEKEISDLRQSGELAQLITSMGIIETHPEL